MRAALEGDDARDLRSLGADGGGGARDREAGQRETRAVGPEEDEIAADERGERAAHVRGTRSDAVEEIVHRRRVTTAAGESEQGAEDIGLEAHVLHYVQH